VGAGTSFNVEEKDFIDALYTIIIKFYDNPTKYEMSDYLAFLKCMGIVFI
jgi:hypothetical protein